MTISEAKLCYQSGMTQAAVLQQLAAARAAQQRTDESLIARVWRPAYASELCQRPMTAYDYNGR